MPPTDKANSTVRPHVERWYKEIAHFKSLGNIISQRLDFYSSICSCWWAVRCSSFFLPPMAAEPPPPLPQWTFSQCLLSISWQQSFPAVMLLLRCSNQSTTEAERISKAEQTCSRPNTPPTHIQVHTLHGAAIRGAPAANIYPLITNRLLIYFVSCKHIVLTWGTTTKNALLNFGCCLLTVTLVVESLLSSFYLIWLLASSPALSTFNFFACRQLWCLCILRVDRLPPGLRSWLLSDALGIYPWLCDPGQPLPHPVVSSELWWQRPYPCHQYDTIHPASINIWRGTIFLGWIIYSAWLETLSLVEDLVACMFVLDLYNKTWPCLIRKPGATELVECACVCVGVWSEIRDRKTNGSGFYICWGLVWTEKLFF